MKYTTYRYKREIDGGGGEGREGEGGRGGGGGGIAIYTLQS
jgi:hypothetical protein